jgi:PAS domain S-box-containing protein
VSYSSSIKSRSAWIAAVLALTGVYYLSGKFGLSLAFLNRSATAVWPPTGVALAALLVWGYGLWPGVFLGAFLVNFAQGPWATSFGIATGNTLEALLGAWLVNQFAGGSRVFDRTKNLFPYLFFAALLSTAVSATCGVTSLCLSGLERWSQFGPVWVTWWLGDMVSNIIVAPFLLLWIATPVEVIKRSRVLETSALFLLVVVVGAVVFLGGSSLIGTDRSLEYLALPPLLWVAFRLGARGAITAAVILVGVALWGTLQGLGPFVRDNANESLLLLQAFMGAITITSLVLALLVSDSRRAEQRLQIQEAVSRVLAEATMLNDAAPRILRALCQEGPWNWAALWSGDQATHELACVGVWHELASKLDHFETVTRQTKLKPGIGLSGGWSSGVPVLIRNRDGADDFPRASAAIAAGFRTLLFVPLRVGHRLSGLMEVFSTAACEPDEEFVHMLDAIGSQVGQFIERKAAEEEQVRLAAIVESSSDAIIGKTLEGIITNWNEGAHRIFGYSADEALGKSIALVIPADRLEEETAILDRVKRGDQIASYETVRIRKDQALIDVALTVSPIKDASGRIIGVAKIARDITEQKNTRRALAETREMLRRYAEDLERRVQERTSKLQDTIQSLDAFCYTIAHDLRGPLRAIIGFSAQLLDQYRPHLDKEGIDYLSRIKNSGNRMDQLILDLLKYGRLNTTELVLETTDLEGLTRKVILSLEDEIRQRRALIRLKEPFLSVLASTVILEQVLANLLTNALKFVPRSIAPQVDIWTEPHNGMVRLCVRDNGIGIKPQYFNKLFRPFSRLVNEQDFSGTGIGLAIVSKGVERMGGGVGVESEPGKGSCFWIDLLQPPARQNDQSVPDG